MMKLGILAGEGNFPLLLINSAKVQRFDIIVIAFEGITDRNILKDINHVYVKLGEVGKVLNILHDFKVEKIIFGGRIARPTSWHDISFDNIGTKWFLKSFVRFFKDDDLLRFIIKKLEIEGFGVISPIDLLENSDFASKGLIGEVVTNKTQTSDIELGIKTAKTLGSLDIGQSVIAQEGIILGVEAVEGTNALIKRCAKLKYFNGSGVLVKVIKPKQDRRIDLPVIGIDTVKNASIAGLSGIAVEANNVIIIDKHEVIDVANKNNLFLIGV